MNTIGGRIRHFRDKLGISASELADIVGVSQSYISHFENNRRVPPLKTLEKIAKALKVTVDDIDMAHVVKENDETDILVKRNPPHLRREDGAILIEVKNVSCAISAKAKPRDKSDKIEFELAYPLYRGFEYAVEKAIFDILQNNKDDLIDIVTENLQKYAEKWQKQVSYTNEMIADLQIIKETKDVGKKDD